MEYDLVSTPTQETVQLVADFLSNLTKQNDNLPTVHLTRFHARTIPAIDIHGYLTRILRYAPCGNEAFLAVLVYLDRMSNPDTYLSTPQFATSTIISLRDARDPSGSGKRLPIVINSYNIHRLLICGIMVAVKFLSDIFYTNSHIARVGGLPVNELNQLEIEFLLLNDFNLTVEVEELQRVGNRLMNGNMSIQTMNESMRDSLHVSTPVPQPELQTSAETAAAVAQSPQHESDPPSADMADAQPSESEAHVAIQPAAPGPAGVHSPPSHPDQDSSASSNYAQFASNSSAAPTGGNPGISAGDPAAMTDQPSIHSSTGNSGNIASSNSASDIANTSGNSDTNTATTTQSASDTSNTPFASSFRFPTAAPAPGSAQDPSQPQRFPVPGPAAKPLVSHHSVADAFNNAARFFDPKPPSRPASVLSEAPTSEYGTARSVFDAISSHATSPTQSPKRIGDEVFYDPSPYDPSDAATFSKPAADSSFFPSNTATMPAMTTTPQSIAVSTPSPHSQYTTVESMPVLASGNAVAAVYGGLVASAAHPPAPSLGHYGTLKGHVHYASGPSPSSTLTHSWNELQSDGPLLRHHSSHSHHSNCRRIHPYSSTYSAMHSRISSHQSQSQSQSQHQRSSTSPQPMFAQSSSMPNASYPLPLVSSVETGPAVAPHAAAPTPQGFFKTPNQTQPQGYDASTPMQFCSPPRSPSMSVSPHSHMEHTPTMTGRIQPPLNVFPAKDETLWESTHPGHPMRGQSEGHSMALSRPIPIRRVSETYDHRSRGPDESGFVVGSSRHHGQAKSFLGNCRREYGDEAVFRDDRSKICEDEHLEDTFASAEPSRSDESYRGVLRRGSGDLDVSSTRSRSADDESREDFGGRVSYAGLPFPQRERDALPTREAHSSAMIDEESRNPSLFETASRAAAAPAPAANAHGSSDAPSSGGGRYPRGSYSGPGGYDVLTAMD